MDNWTFGAEHELSDWDIRQSLPPSLVKDNDDYTIVNSNGVANDPSGKLYHFGGEINTVPTTTIEGQILAVKDIKAHLLGAKTNYRANLHLHIRIPGMKDNLPMLKHIQSRIAIFMPIIFDLIDPIDPNSTNSAVAKKRLKHSIRSRHTIVKGKNLYNQLHATTIEQFFAAEAPKDKLGRPQFQLVSRCGVNLRSLIDNNTIEFRHWAGTLDETKIRNAFYAVVTIINFLMGDESNPESIINELMGLDLPRQQPVDERLEAIYQMTSAHKVGRAVAARNIKALGL